MREILQVIAVIAVWFTVAGIPMAAAESPVDVSICSVMGIAMDAIGDVYFSSTSILYRLDLAETMARVSGNGEPA